MRGLPREVNMIKKADANYIEIDRLGITEYSPAIDELNGHQQAVLEHRETMPTSSRQVGGAMSTGGVRLAIVNGLPRPGAEASDLAPCPQIAAVGISAHAKHACLV